MRTIDFDLGPLTTDELSRIAGAAAGIRRSSIRHGIPAPAHVAVSIIETIVDALAARQAGRPTTTLEVDDFSDEDPDDAEGYRLASLRYLAVVRDDIDEPDGVRRAYAAILADLSDPTPTERAVELARFERLAGFGQ